MKLLLPAVILGFFLLVKAEVPKTDPISAGSLAKPLPANELNRVIALSLPDICDANDFNSL